MNETANNTFRTEESLLYSEDADSRFLIFETTLHIVKGCNLNV
jgi:hypothetical protein